MAEKIEVYTSKTPRLREEIHRLKNKLVKAEKKRIHAKIMEIKKQIREMSKQANKFDKLFRRFCKTGKMTCNCEHGTFRNLITDREVKRYEWSENCPFDHGNYLRDIDKSQLNTFERKVLPKPKVHVKKNQTQSTSEKPQFSVPLEDFSSGVQRTVGHHEDR